jgi:hypothetical protein
MNRSCPETCEDIDLRIKFLECCVNSGADPEDQMHWLIFLTGVREGMKEVANKGSKNG